jgi:protein-S-isoprenylcysteine O-methyltransferase Ste14
MEIRRGPGLGLLRRPQKPAALGTQTSDDKKAPWLYRRRVFVIGGIYWLSFFFGYPIAGLLGQSLQPAFRLFEPWLAAAAIAFTAGGFALRVWAASYLPGSIVYHHDVVADELRVSGPYRFVRNPLYLGNVLQAIGIGMLGPWPVLVILVAAMSAYSFYLAGVEERFLASVRGEAFARYLKAVPSFFPVPGKALPKGSQPASVLGGLRSEAFLGTVTLVVVLYICIALHSNAQSAIPSAGS